MGETPNFKEEENRAHEAYKAGNFSEAAKLFCLLKKDYKALDDNVFAGEMANNASVSYLQGDDPKNALAVLDGVAEVFEAQGDNQKLAVTFGNKAASLEALNQNEKAADLYQKAAEIFSEEGDSELYRNTIQSLSALQLRTGLPIEALTTMKVSMEKAPQKGIKNRFLKRILDIPFQLITPKQ